LKGNVCTCVG